MRAAVCNELFADRPLADLCRLAARAGFQGIELAPHTLAADPAAIPAGRIREIRDTLEGAGLACAGLHWLLTAPAGLHLTTADLALRRRAWEQLRRLIPLCAGLGGPVMVLGSGRQRAGQGIPPAEGRAILAAGLRELAPELAGAGVRLLLEPLPGAATDPMRTLAEVAAVVGAVGREAVGGMFDFHNTAGEAEPWEGLIARRAALIGHVHLNEMDGTHPSLAARPGRSRSDYLPAFRALAAAGYAGWISLEIFQAAEPAETILGETREFLTAVERALDG